MMDRNGQKVLQLVRNYYNLFITGKAGTGKTTLLREIYNTFKEERNIAVLAPTGVAAYNAHGMTIHSFLRVPTSPYRGDIKIPNLYSLTKDQEEVIKKLDVIIIDEVSMVRADTLDAMDDILRHYRRRKYPFGGVQIIMFGDLYQLMPVATSEDSEILKDNYRSFYFFKAKVLEDFDYSVIELNKIYRQSDNIFITLLNNVRIGNVSLEELSILNMLYNPNSKAIDEDNIITLTTHNKRAWAINNRKLNELEGEEETYHAMIKGWYRYEDLPTEKHLSLKKGARVMFIRNDNTYHLYYNGMMGKVKRCGYDYVEVLPDGKDKSIVVHRCIWENTKYVLNKQTKKLEAVVCGSCTQIPLKLAWAVTIHKSQGLTFEKANIDAERSFTYGQVYVALSRCKSFFGLVLTSPINEKSIQVDPLVKEYLSSADKIVLSEEKEKIKHIHFTNPELKTLWLVKNNLSVEQICKMTKERKEIIYSHALKLMEKNQFDFSFTSTFLDTETYRLISEAYVKTKSNDRKIIKQACNGNVSYGQIQIFLYLEELLKNPSFEELKSLSQERKERESSLNESKESVKIDEYIPLIESISMQKKRPCNIVLLLTMMKLIETEVVTTNLIPVWKRTVKAFSQIWKDFQIPRTKIIHFYVLQGFKDLEKESFCRLVPKNKNIDNSFSSWEEFKEKYSGLEIEEDLFKLMKDANNREKLSDILLARISRY